VELDSTVLNFADLINQALTFCSLLVTGRHKVCPYIFYLLLCSVPYMLYAISSYTLNAIRYTLVIFLFRNTFFNFCFYFTLFGLFFFLALYFSIDYRKSNILLRIDPVLYLVSIFKTNFYS